MSSSIPPKGSDVANEKLREMGVGTAVGHTTDSKSNYPTTSESNDRIDSSLAGGITIGPAINGKQIN
ncbi:hypothetical protein I4U23_021767 [Adineta vaga]|nr:hypothetical protein I4U23_021767 [Adineta vaga]